MRCRLPGPHEPAQTASLAGDLRLARRCEGRHLLMPDMHPFDGAPLSQRLGEAVQAVADHAEDALDARLFQGLTMRSATLLAIINSPDRVLLRFPMRGYRRLPEETNQVAWRSPTRSIGLESSAQFAGGRE